MMSISEGLEIPPEPLEIKEQILREAREWGSLDKAHIWGKNRLQSYLWSRWKSRLRERGYTWQEFLRVMKLASTAALHWAEGRITWEEFVNQVIWLINTGARPGRLVG